MTGRVTRPPDPDDLPSMRERNPAMWWVAIITILGLVLGTVAGMVFAIFA